MRLSSISLALVAFLTGCGGGGGSDAPSSAGGSTSTQLSLDTSNYVVASTESASASLYLLDAPAIAVGVESTDLNEAVRFGLEQVPALGSWFKGPVAATGVVQTQTSACAISGSITASVNDADNNNALSAGDSVTITANNCKPNSTSIVNGGVTVQVAALSGDLATNFYNATLKLIYSNLQAATSAGSVSANGDLTLAASASGVNVRSQSVAASSLVSSATFGSTTYNRTLKDFSTTLAMVPNGAVSTFKTTSTVKGTISSSAFGGKSVTVATVTPFVRLSTDAYPSIGQATLTGFTTARTRLTVQNAVSVLIELDANADGIYEASTVKAWSAIR
jgi:hypothetical protein